MSPKNLNDSKPLKPRAIEDIFERRQPSDSEQHWAEKTLDPLLEKSPEKTIGAATGTNLDENGNARYSTISNVPVRRLYTPADLPEDWMYVNNLGHTRHA